jgi:glutaminase
MRAQADSEARAGSSYVSTGHLPDADLVTALVAEAHARYKSNGEGANSQVYPALAAVPSELFGVCVGRHQRQRPTAAGDTDYPFSIMSVSKPFVFAMVCQSIGAEQAREKLGANSTGLPFIPSPRLSGARTDGRTRW